MSEEFVANIDNLNSYQERQAARLILKTIPKDKMISVRGMYEGSVRTLTLLKILVMTDNQYKCYRNDGGKYVYINAGVYRELNNA